VTLLAYLIAVLVFLPAFYGAVYGGSRALHHWQHGRCLARIEKLERELSPPAHPRSSYRSPEMIVADYQRGFDAGASRRPSLEALWSQAEASRRARDQRRRSGKRGMWYGS
jgi:hypothetical protein